MAGKVVGFRIKLEGEKATLDALNAVKDALGKNGKAIDEIKFQSFLSNGILTKTTKPQL